MFPEEIKIPSYLINIILQFVSILHFCDNSFEWDLTKDTAYVQIVNALVSDSMHYNTSSCLVILIQGFSLILHFTFFLTAHNMKLDKTKHPAMFSVTEDGRDFLDSASL